MGERNAAAINARAPASGAPGTASTGRSSDLDGIRAPVGALTADQLSINESHAQPAGGSRSGTVLDKGGIPPRQRTVPCDGSRLSQQLEQTARTAGDSDMVVSATPSENTVRFYLGRRFQPTADPLAEPFQLEPDDAHMQKML